MSPVFLGAPGLWVGRLVVLREGWGECGGWSYGLGYWGVFAGAGALLRGVCTGCCGGVFGVSWVASMLWLMQDIAFFSVLDLAAAIRSRSLSSVELLDLYLERFVRLNPRLNALVSVDWEGGRRQAVQADAALARGEVRGPLHGVPITVSDSLSVAGVVTTNGDPELAGNVPQKDAVAIARCKAAGAVVFAKSNVGWGDWEAVASNPLFGATRNPWDMGRSTGGAAGGAGASVAAGLTALDIGRDIGGSLRVPAHYCGVYAHRPSRGVVPVEGPILLDGAIFSQEFAATGVMGRSVADLSLGLELIGGPDVQNARGWTLQLPAPRRRSLSECRIAVWAEGEGTSLDTSGRELMEHVAETLRKAGAFVDETARPGFSLLLAHQVFRQLRVGMAALDADGDVFGPLPLAVSLQAERVQALVAQYLAYGTQSYRDWQSANELRNYFSLCWERFFHEFDVVLMPVMPTAAPRWDFSEEDLCFLPCAVLAGDQAFLFWDETAWVTLPTLCSLPATVIPAGKTQEGLPVGVQLVGPYLDDLTTLRLGGWLSSLLGGFSAPPGT